MAIRATETKVGLLVPPQLKDNGAPSGLTYIDTQGYHHCRILIVTGTTDIATTAAPQVSECDTTDGQYADITAAVLADAISATEDDGFHAIDVDLTNGTRKRYLRLDITAGDGTTGMNLCVIGQLSRPTKHPTSATLMGLTERIDA